MAHLDFAGIIAAVFTPEKSDASSILRVLLFLFAHVARALLLMKHNVCVEMVVVVDVEDT